MSGYRMFRTHIIRCRRHLPERQNGGQEVNVARADFVMVMEDE